MSNTKKFFELFPTLKSYLRNMREFNKICVEKKTFKNIKEAEKVDIEYYNKMSNNLKSIKNEKEN